MRSGSVAEVHCARCGADWTQTDRSFIGGKACGCWASLGMQPRWSFEAKSGLLVERFITVPHNFVMISKEKDLRWEHKTPFSYHDESVAA